MAGCDGDGATPAPGRGATLLMPPCPMGPVVGMALPPCRRLRTVLLQSGGPRAEEEGAVSPWT